VVGDPAAAHFKLRAMPGAALFRPSYQRIATHLGALLRGPDIRWLLNGEAFAYDLCNAGIRSIRFTARQVPASFFLLFASRLEGRRHPC
jgi:hypothetical protein